MKKKVIGCCIFFICVSFIFAEGTENKKKFIKGNLSEKTAIVKQAPVNEVVELATDAIDCIHTTAASHNRVFIVEVMGHKVGWLTLYAGIAGGADIILLPEIPYDIDKVVKAIKEREKRGSHFTILAVAEGAISKEDAKLSKKEFKEKLTRTNNDSEKYFHATLPKAEKKRYRTEQGVFNQIYNRKNGWMKKIKFQLTN